MKVRESQGNIKVVQLPNLSYEEYIAFQTDRVSKRKRDRVVDTVSVVSFRGSAYTTPESDQPSVIDIEEVIYTAKRGGDDSWHGLGQIGIGPVIRVDRDFYVRDLTNLLEAPVRRVLEDYGVTPDEHAEGDFPGITVEGRKIAQVGLHLDERVTSYGLAFNVTCDLSKFEAINLCGIENCDVTNLATESDRPVELEEVFDLLVKYVKEAFLHEEDMPSEGVWVQDGAEPQSDPNK